MNCTRTVCLLILFALPVGVLAMGPGAGGGDTGSAMRKLASFVDRSEEAMEICEGQSSFIDCVNSYSNNTVKLHKTSCFPHLQHNKVTCNVRKEQLMKDFSSNSKTCYVNVARTMCACDSTIFVRNTKEEALELYYKVLSGHDDEKEFNNKDNTRQE